MSFPEFIGYGLLILWAAIVTHSVAIDLIREWTNHP